jgi:hypothetical protein
MQRKIHEIRDAIHVFIRLDTAEHQVPNSWPAQRLRHIHQLALTNLVYPGATHRRFEHSLGVMEAATRIYETVTTANNVHDKVRYVVPKAGSREHFSRWLGHASVTTTNRYATADLEMKRKAIEQAQGTDHTKDDGAALWRADASILAWLEAL